MVSFSPLLAVYATLFLFVALMFFAAIKVWFFNTSVKIQPLPQNQQTEAQSGAAAISAQQRQQQHQLSPRALEQGAVAVRGSTQPQSQQQQSQQTTSSGQLFMCLYYVVEIEHVLFF